MKTRRPHVVRIHRIRIHKGMLEDDRKVAALGKVYIGTLE